jgi:hypothetical protein
VLSRRYGSAQSRDGRLARLKILEQQPMIAARWQYRVEFDRDLHPW